MADPHPNPAPPSRRHRLRPVLLLLLALAGIDLAVIAFRGVWERYSPDDYKERLDGCRRRPQDFVLVGGSPVSEGLDPGFLVGAAWRGRPLAPGYALGLPGGTASEFFHAVRHGCPTPPRLLVYGITASDLNDARHEPHGPGSLMTWGDLATWAVARPDSREWVTRHFLLSRLNEAWSLYRYRHGIRMWAALQADALFPGSCPAAVREAKELRSYADALRAGNGYAPAAGFVLTRYDFVKRAGVTGPPFNFLDKYRTGSHLTYLHKLLDWADSRGTTVVLLDMPVTADLDAKYPAAVAEYRRLLADMGRCRGVTVLRAGRDVLGFTDAQFADLIHLNRDGCERLSKWLRAKLEDLGRNPVPDAATAGRAAP